MEDAAGGAAGRARHIAGQRDARPGGAGLDAGHGRQQRIGVGMFRLVEHGRRGADLDDATEIHHRGPVAQISDGRYVVRDVNDRQPEIAAEGAQEPQDARAHGHIEHRDRLVGNDELGAKHHRPGDGDALALAAA